tara:strand:+ start:6738 stop:7586 length:849 start_codon:yes stop_codon:yes gene_type:complete
MIKKNLNNIAGVTLIEILIGIVISVLMMAAMFTSYNVVNNSYSKVVDRAKVSSQGRDYVGMMLRDIRNAGFTYYNDDVKASSEHAPLIITKATNFNTECDKLDIVYGDVDYAKNQTPKYVYQRYKITYECKKSKLQNKSAPPLPGGKFPPINAFAIYKSKMIWDKAANVWKNPITDGRDDTYEPQLLADYIEDMVFLPIDENGMMISPPPTPSNANKNKLYEIKTVDIGITIRSSKNFFREKRDRKKNKALNNTVRTKAKDDRYFRDVITVTAHARNLGGNK